jgi:hypothetical protein
MLGPMQEMMSWMLNSHLFNVRAVLNNTLVVNPQMVDMEDLKKKGPGRVIKLKPAAFGQDRHERQPARRGQLWRSQVCHGSSADR